MPRGLQNMSSILRDALTVRMRHEHASGPVAKICSGLSLLLLHVPPTRTLRTRTCTDWVLRYNSVSHSSSPSSHCCQASSSRSVQSISYPLPSMSRMSPCGREGGLCVQYSSVLYSEHIHTGVHEACACAHFRKICKLKTAHPSFHSTHVQKVERQLVGGRHLAGDGHVCRQPA